MPAARQGVLLLCNGKSPAGALLYKLSVDIREGRLQRFAVQAAAFNLFPADNEICRLQLVQAFFLQVCLQFRPQGFRLRFQILPLGFNGLKLPDAVLNHSFCHGLSFLSAVKRLGVLCCLQQSLSNSYGMPCMDFAIFA